ncbi:hypothetical protein Bca101_075528 [Brassica carinata]
MGKNPGKEYISEYVDLPSLAKSAVLEETTMEISDFEALKGIRSPIKEGLLAMGCCCAPVTIWLNPPWNFGRGCEPLEVNMLRNKSSLYSPTETRS